jgi:uncharacterized protein
MPTDWWFWAMAAIATLCVGASKGGLPGIGILSVPILAQAIRPVEAAGLLLPLYLVSDVYGLWLYRKSYDLTNMKIILPAATLGILIGWATASFNNDAVVKFIVGVVGVWYALDIFFRAKRNREPRPADIPRGAFWGTLAGFTSFVAHAGGVPYQMYVLPQKLEKMVYAGTSTIIFAIINMLKVPPYFFLGQITTGSLQICVALTPVALFGAFAGYRLTTMLPQDLFFRLVEVALFLLSLKLLYDALFGSH